MKPKRARSGRVPWPDSELIQTEGLIPCQTESGGGERLVVEVEMVFVERVAGDGGRGEVVVEELGGEGRAGVGEVEGVVFGAELRLGCRWEGKLILWGSERLMFVWVEVGECCLRRWPLLRGGEVSALWSGCVVHRLLNFVCWSVVMGSVA